MAGHSGRALPASGRPRCRRGGWASRATWGRRGQHQHIFPWSRRVPAEVHRVLRHWALL